MSLGAKSNYIPVVYAGTKKKKYNKIIKDDFKIMINKAIIIAIKKFLKKVFTISL